MYRIKQTSKYKKDLKRIKRRGYDISLLKVIIKKLSLGENWIGNTKTTVYRVFFQGLGNAT